MGAFSFERLCDHIKGHEDWLSQRVTDYVEKYGYIQPQLTPEQAARISVRGLSEAMLTALKAYKYVPELTPDDDFTNDPIASVGIVEAQRCRATGVPLTTSLILIKHYRQSYFDLVSKAGFERHYEEPCRLFVERFFDRLEIGFCLGPAEVPPNNLIKSRPNAQEELRKAEAKYRSLVENIPAVTYVAALDEMSTKFYISPQIESILGLSPANLQDRPKMWQDQLHPDDRHRVMDEISPGHAPQERFLSEYRMLGRNGRVVWFRDEATLVRDTDGKPLFFQGVMLDITARRRLENRQKLLATAVDQAAEAIIITDRSGSIQYVNPSFERISGYSRDEVIGQNPRILNSGQHNHTFYSELWRTITNGQVWTGRFINKKKDGAFYQEDATISPVRDPSGNIVNFVAVKRDITQEVELEKQLLHAQKMEAIGTLAGGIAHDFNNLLTIVLGYSELLLMEKDDMDPMCPDLQKITMAARNGAKLVQGLLTFGRKVEPKLQPLNLNHEVERVNELLVRTIPRMIAIELHLGANLRTINADSAQLGQLIMNLAVNAKDAMPEGGKLTIETRNVTLDEDYCSAHLDAKPGRYVVLSVGDTGCGMDKQIVEHIFEPFFTTKSAGQGTGLGLAMVYGIVKQHRGYIKCYSEPGAGTTFKTYFPVIEKKGRGQKVLFDQSVPGGTETILLVDDEESIRELGRRFLTRAGYTVLTAANGEEALELYKKEGHGISLVILDLIMPEMGGKRCFEELLKIDPKVRVLMASGYFPDGATREGAGGNAGGFIGKPYEMKEILRGIRKILDGSE